MFNEPKINKKILSPGNQYKKISNGSRLKFHFKTIKCDVDKTVIDDSKALGKPMELVIGKKFKLEVWEVIVQSMAVNEIASFTVDKSLLHSYPLVSKTLRDASKPDRVRPRQCCGQIMQGYSGEEFKDLNDLMKSPCDLEFIIELLSVENEGEYERESWQLTEEDRINEIPKLREEGNNLYKQEKYLEAAQKYSTAIGYLDNLMLSEKPNDKEWNELNSKRLPLLLNYAQCKLNLKEYYEVIEHCSTVLKFEPENVKALFRRGKAHASVWNHNEAKQDFNEALRLDPSLNLQINKLLKEIDSHIKDGESVLKDKLKGKLFENK